MSLVSPNSLTLARWPSTSPSTRPTSSPKTHHPRGRHPVGGLDESDRLAFELDLKGVDQESRRFSGTASGRRHPPGIGRPVRPTREHASPPMISTRLGPYVLGTGGAWRGSPSSPTGTCWPTPFKRNRSFVILGWYWPFRDRSMREQWSIRSRNWRSGWPQELPRTHSWQSCFRRAYRFRGRLRDHAKASQDRETIPWGISGWSLIAASLGCSSQRALGSSRATPGPPPPDG